MSFTSLPPINPQPSQARRDTPAMPPLPGVPLRRGPRVSFSSSSAREGGAGAAAAVAAAGAFTELRTTRQAFVRPIPPSPFTQPPPIMLPHSTAPPLATTSLAEKEIVFLHPGTFPETDLQKLCDAWPKTAIHKDTHRHLRHNRLPHSVYWGQAQGLNACKIRLHQTTTKRSDALAQVIAAQYRQQLVATFPGLGTSYPLPGKAFAIARQPDLDKNAREIAVDTFVLRGLEIKDYIKKCNRPVSEPSIEFFALFDILSLQPNRKITDFLVQDFRTLVPIRDGNMFFSQGHARYTRFFWEKYPLLQKKPPQAIKEWVENLDPEQLRRIAEETCEKMDRKYAELLGESSPSDRYRSQFDSSRVLPHQIALHFLKHALREGWTIAQIGGFLFQNDPNEEGIGISGLYQEVNAKGSTPDAIDVVCQEHLRKHAEGRPAVWNSAYPVAPGAETDSDWEADGR